MEREHSKSLLQHVKNIRSEKQLHQMLGTDSDYDDNDNDDDSDYDDDNDGDDDDDSG